MTIQNPTNQPIRKNVANPVFWQRIGIPFTWFLALYPWLVALWDQVAPRIHTAIRGAPLRYPTIDFVPLKINNVGYDLPYRAWHEWIYPYYAGQGLFLVGLAWFTLAAAAAMAGLVPWRTWIVTVLVAATGIAAVFFAQYLR